MKFRPNYPKTVPAAGYLTLAAAAFFVSACTSSGGPELSQALTPLPSGSQAAPVSAYAAASPAQPLDPIAVASIGGETAMASSVPLRGSVADTLAEQPLPMTEEQLAEQRIAVLYPQIKHGTCKGGWGKQAHRLDAERVTPGHPYYIEIRMRNTPPLPIGHTYTAYGRLSPSGKKLDEHLVMLAPVGGYAGAAVAGAVPMPGKMMPSKTDCNIRPKAAYRVSLTAQQYEKLLMEIKQAKIDRPKYHLFAYNCNHFTSRISQAVGIRAPRNKYTSSLVYMYDIIKENERRS